MQQRRKYSEEFKREAIVLTRQPDASVAQIALDTAGLDDSLRVLEAGLRGWDQGDSTPVESRSSR